MTTNEQLTETLNDLVKINNDRIEVCEKADDKTTASDTAMQTVFLAMADTSRTYIKDIKDIKEFNEKIYNPGGMPATDFNTTGKIYKEWMGAFDENTAQANKNALKANLGMNIELRKLIMVQSKDLKKSFDILKYRHLHVA